MIEVVIVDDIEYFRDLIKKILVQEFQKERIDINIFQFEGFNKNFWKIATTKKYKLFILDIEVNDINGIDVARKIRTFDIRSDIIFITAYDTIKYKNLILYSTIKPLSFINKKNIKIDLIEKISYIKQMISEEPCNDNKINFKNKNKSYQLTEKNIDFFEVNKINHKIIIHTIDSVFEVDNTIQNIEVKPDKNKFIKTHRSCIINLLNVKQVDYKNSSIIFYSENKTKLLSRNKKKELKNRLKGEQY